MNHRVKNVLAMVQAIGARTLRESGSLESFEAAFNGRLIAVAQAHNLLVDGGWAGADVGMLIDRILAPYRRKGRDPITIDGPSISLPPQKGVALTMILHELATNAAKYGALSAPTGRLEVTWRVDGNSRGDLRLRWIESGGPPAEPPSRRGFGLDLIERSTAYELNGLAAMDFLEMGLQVELVFPLPAEPDRPSQEGPPL
jgi:two-component sensor histidine kinase